jgi:hypothetical protein
LLSTQCYQACYRHNVIRLVIDTMLSGLLSTQCYQACYRHNVIYITVLSTRQMFVYAEF